MKRTMCGITIVGALRGRTPSVTPQHVTAMRDLLAARGPDDAGLWSDGQVHIGHRRLAINTPGANRQPWVLDGPEPLVLAFNGELYDCDELRASLEERGHRVRIGSDTELLAHAIAEWGADAPHHLRGMFAYAAWLPARQTLLVARDALGVVPLFLAVVCAGGGDEIVVASEPRAILGHPAIEIEPDWATVATYLNSLRTTRERFTLFKGVECVQPGERCTIDLSGDRARIERSTWWSAPAEDDTLDEAAAARLVRNAIERSVAAHCVSDVPLCSLLSGGIDSTIVAALARGTNPGLATFCAGAPSEGEDDLTVARAVAAALGTDHRDVPIGRDAFVASWPAMVEALGTPLSTPNEVAIHAVACALRSVAKVTLSGEGADELFAGYGPPIAEAERWIAQARAGGAATAPAVEEWQTNVFGWVAPGLLASILRPEPAAAGGAEACLATARAAFARCGDPLRLRTHLDVQRSLNLPSLLQRLNTATMLAGVEGRTPFADLRVAELAARIPVAIHCPAEGPASGDGGGGLATATLPRTKRVLRRAFADLIPQVALVRPKASFPLPFERWLGEVPDAIEALRSETARAVMHPEAIELVAARPQEHWRIAWPMMNLALWLRRWWR